MAMRDEYVIEGYRVTWSKDTALGMLERPRTYRALYSSGRHSRAVEQALTRSKVVNESGPEVVTFARRLLRQSRPINGAEVGSCIPNTWRPRAPGVRLCCGGSASSPGRRPSGCCSGCAHLGRVNPVRLWKAPDPTETIVELRIRMECSQCGARALGMKPMFVGKRRD